MRSLAVAIGVAMLVLPSAVHAAPGVPLGPVDDVGGTEDAPVGTTGASASGHQYRLQVRCPANTTHGDPGEPYTYTGCPFRIWDEQDVLGQPALMVNPSNTSQVAFASLHGAGGADEDGPSHRSRSGQQHTTFTSTDKFVHQTDNPYSNGAAGVVADEVYGEHVSATMDDEGRLYVAPLYATQEDGEDGYNYVLAPHKWESVFHVGGQIQSSPITTDTAHATIERPRMTHNNETGMVVLSWLEIPEGESRGRVRAFVTAEGVDTTWAPLRLEDQISPCTSITSAATWDKYVYIGCVNKPGPAEIYAIELPSGNVSMISRAPFGGASPELAIGPDGYSVIAGVTRVSDTQVEANIAWGRWGADWTLARDYGETFKTEAPETIETARIQDMIYRPDSGTVHVLYMERYNRSGSLENPRMPNADPEYRKAVFSIHGEAGVLRKLDLEVGRPKANWAFPPTHVDPEGDVFDDLRDSLVLHQLPNGTYREWIAYDNYGVVDFARLHEHAPGLSPLPAGMFSNSPVFPTASAAGSASGALQISGSQLLFGAALGTLSFAMMARLMGVQNESESTVKAGSKG